MCGGPARPVALPGETASRLFELFGCAQLAEMVELFGGYDLSVADLVVPQTQSAALVAHSQHDPESRRRIRSKQPPAASRASPKRVRVETPTRGPCRASELTPVKEESAASKGFQCEHGRRRWACSDCHPCACTDGELVDNRWRKDKCSDCNPCECTQGKPAGERIRKDYYHPCNACACPVRMCIEGFRAASSKGQVPKSGCRVTPCPGIIQGNTPCMLSLPSFGEQEE